MVSYRKTLKEEQEELEQIAKILNSSLVNKEQKIQDYQNMIQKQNIQRVIALSSLMLMTTGCSTGLMMSSPFSGNSEVIKQSDESKEANEFPIQVNFQNQKAKSAYDRSEMNYYTNASLKNEMNENHSNENHSNEKHFKESAMIMPSSHSSTATSNAIMATAMPSPSTVQKIKANKVKATPMKKVTATSYQSPVKPMVKAKAVTTQVKPVDAKSMIKQENKMAKKMIKANVSQDAMPKEQKNTKSAIAKAVTPSATTQSKVVAKPSSKEELQKAKDKLKQLDKKALIKKANKAIQAVPTLP